MTFYIIISILYIILCITLIIKFFQIASDVRDIKDFLKGNVRNNSNNVVNATDAINDEHCNFEDLKIGDRVVIISTNQGAEIADIKIDGTIMCVNPESHVLLGNFKAYQLKK